MAIVTGQQVNGRPRLRYVGAALAPAEQRDRSWFLDRLEALAEWGGWRIDIFSGSGGPDVRGGGFAGDPHSRGIGADATIGGRPIGEVVPAGAFARFGLRTGNVANFYQGRPDPSHVDALDAAGRSVLSSPGASRSRPRSGAGASGGAYSYPELMALWVKAGGPAKWAPIMAAVALAESGGNAKANLVTSREDSRGLWQINVRAHPDLGLLDLYNANINAAAAVRVFLSSGPGAWSTYSSGAYKNALPSGPPAPVPTLPARPSLGGGGGGVLGDFESALGDVFHFGEDAAGGALAAALALITGPVEFYKFMVALLNPVNILRAVELLAGFGLIVLGLKTLRDVHAGADTPAARVRAGASKIAKKTPGGALLMAAK